MEKQTKICQNCKQNFVIEPEDFLFYEKIKVPPPTFCPECRFQRRLTFRNERTLYKRKCDMCGEMKVMNYSPAWQGKVYCPKCWWSDKWDAAEYGRDYDFNKSFFEQFSELIKKFPQMGLAVSYATMINSDFCHMANDLKNCYLVTHSNNNEDCVYASALTFSKDCFDILAGAKCELCHEIIECAGCYRAYFSESCTDCIEVYFSKSLINCQNCFGCVNLRHRQYYIFNKSYSKEDYFEKLKEMGINKYKNIEKFKNLAREFWLKNPVKYISGLKNVNVSGDYIYNSKNAINCYVSTGVEDSKFCQYLSVNPVRDCYDYTEWGDNVNLIYDSINLGQGVSNSKFNYQSWDNCRNLEYTSYCMSSSNLFGCVSLRHKEYSILNKQYSKDDFEKLRAKIIQQMREIPYVDKKGRIYKYGEFFPIELSPFGYNETTAQEFFPMSEEEIKKQGYNYVNIQKYRGKYESTIKAEDLPDDIHDVGDTILKEIISCAKCGSPYKIIKQEFEFYKKLKIALPRLCPDCRYSERFNRRNLPKLYKRKCSCIGETSVNGIYQNIAKHFHGTKHCSNEFETTYFPERKEIVYCEQCYNNEVV